MNERKPLLSDDVMVNLCEDGQLYPWQTEARKVRDFYEHLITAGKLRVVKEIEVDWPLCGFTNCPVPKCGRVIIYPEDNFCPGCGNPIKR